MSDHPDHHADTTLRARLGGLGGTPVVLMLITVAAMAVVLWRLTREHETIPAVVFTGFAFLVIVQTLIGFADGPRRRPSGHSDAHLDVVALVPVFNEDPAALYRCLDGFLTQTRRPSGVVVVDDGSTAADYDTVMSWFTDAAAAAGIRAHWARTVNGGKRAAQAVGVRLEPNADIYITVDSDSILDPEAVQRALPAFADPTVQSVAAIVLSTNYRQSLLARTMDLYCVGLQLFERSAFSRFDAVMVNSGGCAFYRGAVIRDNLHCYLNETVFGRPVHFSDDSMLTLFALERGKAVQQADCFAFTLMPATFSHHYRQQLRWMRGSFIRSGWRARHLPAGGAAFWLHLLKWFVYAIMTGTLAHLAATGHFGSPADILTGLLAAITLYTFTCIRYLTVRRSDQSLLQRLLTVATAPLAAIWSLTFLRILRWYAMATFTRTGWGTRTVVEIRDHSTFV